jgi:hypothetical protein
MCEQLHPYEPINHRIELGYQPEEHEIWTGQKILVIGGPDAHGVSMAAESALWLQTKGAKAQVMIGSPVVNHGEGATHPGAFWTKTIGNIDVTDFDRVVICDIPLDAREEKYADSPQVRHSERMLIDLAFRVNQARRARGLEPLERSVFYLDHHVTSTFDDALPTSAAVQLKNVESHGIAIKSVASAEACHLGRNSTMMGRIGAIADRESAVLPITPEEMELATGLDVAVRPEIGDLKPSDPTELKAWEHRAQARLDLAVAKLMAGDWDYFRQESGKLNSIDLPVSSGFGEVIIVDTQDLTDSSFVFKLMERALEKQGINNHAYAIAIKRNQGDGGKMSREPADLVTVLRHWQRTDLPDLRETLETECGQDFLDSHHFYGAANVQTARLPINDLATANIVHQLVESLAGTELPDLRGIKSVVMCGDPNSGKSVLSTLLRESLNNLGVHVAHLDLDKAAPTPEWYLEAEINAAKAEKAYANDKLSQADFDTAINALNKAKAQRKALKRPWTLELAEEARDELVTEAKTGEQDFVIGDIGGGLITRDEYGKIVKVQRLTKVNATILSGTDAVIVVSSNQAGAEEWVRLIQAGIDPETGIAIHRDSPIKIIAIYQSVLEGDVQTVASERQAGVITNLDRTLTDRMYNPSITALSLMIAGAVRTEHSNGELHHQAAELRNPYQVQLREIASTYMEQLEDLLPEGCRVELGGSLLSDTALKGHNDIDLRILLPEGLADEVGIREISEKIHALIPFQKVRPVGSPGQETFAVMHQLELEIPEIEGGVEIEASVRPADGYVGFAQFQSSLPQALLDQYVVFKHHTRDTKPQYKKVKEQFYALTRFLYAQGYWNEAGQVIGNQDLLSQARAQFWGNNLEDILLRSTPEI